MIWKSRAHWAYMKYMIHLARHLIAQGYPWREVRLICQSVSEQVNVMQRHEGLELDEALSQLPSTHEFAQAHPTQEGASRVHALGWGSLIMVVLNSTLIVWLEFQVARGGPDSYRDVGALLVWLGYPMAGVMGLVGWRSMMGRCGAVMAWLLFALFLLAS